VLGVELQVLQVPVAQDGLPLEGGLVVVAEEDGHVPFRPLLEGLEAE
jgi:DNA mismatch repair protein MutH